MRPPPPPSPVSKLDRGYTGRLRKRDNLLKEGGREDGGWARSRIILQQENLFLYKSFNTHCRRGSIIDNWLQFCQGLWVRKRYTVDFTNYKQNKAMFLLCQYEIISFFDRHHFHYHSCHWYCISALCCHLNCSKFFCPKNVTLCSVQAYNTMMIQCYCGSHWLYVFYCSQFSLRLFI